MLFTLPPRFSTTDPEGAAILRKTRKLERFLTARNSDGPQNVSQNGQRRKGLPQRQEVSNLLSPDVLVFADRRTGSLRFQVPLDGDKDAAMDRAASLLALGCMVRGELPKDYAIWVPADENLIRRIARQAEELLRLGRSFACTVPLSPRESEVLKELLRNRVNKEIAGRLNISVRTVKFHVSSLLEKFGVASRWDLIQKAQRLLGTRELPDELPVPSAQPSEEQAATAHPSLPGHWHAHSTHENSRKNSRIVLFHDRRLRPA